MQKLECIQFARAFAAIGVLFAHMCKEMVLRSDGRFSDPLSIWNHGQAGVDLFFVISGFIMIYVTDKKIGSSGGGIEFLRKRALRVVPPYWIYATLALLIAIISPKLRNFHDTDTLYIISSYLFFPTERPSDHQLTPFYALGWTLNYEMYFYFSFALLMQFSRKYFTYAFFSYFLITVVVLGLLNLRNTAPALWYWTQPIVLEFALGGLIGMLYLRGVIVTERVGYLLLTIAFVWWISAGNWFPEPTLSERLYVWGCPAALMVASLVLSAKNFYDRLPLTARKLAVTIGDSSYSLYLSHMFIIRCVTLTVPVSVLGVLYPIAYPIVCTSLCIAAAYYSFKFIEKPLAYFK